jgi:peptidoglycan/LPS O-acetylase OafA/YrhL
MTATAQPSTKPKAGTGLIASLVGIRGVFAVVVVLVHLAPFGVALVPSLDLVWTAIWRSAYPVLDLFLVLSGFVIAAGYRGVFARWPGRVRYGRFLWARLSRFYPLHLAVMLALVAAVVVGSALGLSVPHGGDLGWDLVRSLLLTQGWGWQETLTWNGPTWSLSAEWFCYLAIPVIMPFVLWFKRPSSVLVAYFVVMAVPLVVYSFIGFDDRTITAHAPLWRAVAGFVGGALLNQLLHTGSRLPAFVGRFTGLVTFLAFAAFVGLHVGGLPPMLAVWFAGFMILALAQQRGAVDRVLASRPMMIGGEYSVALFLTHVPFILAASVILNPRYLPGALGWLGIAGYVAGILACTIAGYHLIERPAQKWMRRRVAPR